MRLNVNLMDERLKLINKINYPFFGGCKCKMCSMKLKGKNRKIVNRIVRRKLKENNGREN